MYYFMILGVQGLEGFANVYFWVLLKFQTPNTVEPHYLKTWSAEQSGVPFGTQLNSEGKSW